MEGKKTLGKNYRDNVSFLDDILSVSDNFDLIKKTLNVGDDRLTLYYIDGFIKDGVMSKMIIYFLSASKSMGFFAFVYLPLSSLTS